MATLLLGIVYISFISLGLPDSLLGVAWPVMHLDVGVDVSAGGLMAFIGASGTIVSSFFSARMIKRFGTGKVTFVSVTMTAVALLGISFAPHYVVLCLLGAPLGLGAGAVDAALNNFVALHYKAKHMNWLHCFWGIGATMGPMIMALFIGSQGGWRQGYLVISLIQIALVVTLFISLPLWKRFEASVQEVSAHIEHRPFSRIIRIKGVKPVMLVFFCYCGLEGAAGLWSGSYLVLGRGLDPSTAASWVSTFYLGITAGRLLSGFLAIKVSNIRLIVIGQIVCAIGLVLFILPMSPYFALAGLILLGLGCAPIFPSMLHETPARFGKPISQAMMGIQMASAYTGATLIPPVIGALFGRIGFGFLPGFMAMLLAVMSLMTQRTRRLSYKRSGQNDNK